MASDDLVPLTELDIITRWSLAVRQPEVDRAELISVLRSDLEWLEDGAKLIDDAPAAALHAPVGSAKRPRKSPAKRAVAKPTTRRSIANG